MDFSLSEDQRALRESVRKFATSELPEVAVEVEKSRESPGPELMKKFADMGYLGVNLPTELGGQGLGHLEAIIVMEEIAKISSPLAFPVFESSFGPLLAVVHFAPHELKQRIVPQVCAGEMIVVVAMSEPNAGTALTDLTTKAEAVGDEIVINGNKRWCSGAGHSGAYVVLPYVGCAGSALNRCSSG